MDFFDDDFEDDSGFFNLPYLVDKNSKSTVQVDKIIDFNTSNISNDNQENKKQQDSKQVGQISLMANQTYHPIHNNNNNNSITTPNGFISKEKKIMPIHKSINNVQTNRINSPSNDDENERFFRIAMSNPMFRFNPVKLGFIPSSFWSDNDVSFGDIVKIFFRRKNNSKCRFPHKLYHALILSSINPRMFSLIGARWIDNTLILINRQHFARLLGIKAIEGSLFHQQGNFPSHGFVEIDPMIVKKKFPDFDFTQNRIIKHNDGVFVYGCTEKDIEVCKWNHSSK